MQHARYKGIITATELWTSFHICTIDADRVDAYLLSQVQTSVVGHEHPANAGTQQGNRPGDPELVAVAQVVEPHHHTDGANLTSGSRNSMCSTPNGSWVHLQQKVTHLIQ